MRYTTKEILYQWPNEHNVYKMTEEDMLTYSNIWKETPVAMWNVKQANNIHYFEFEEMRRLTYK